MLRFPLKRTFEWCLSNDGKGQLKGDINCEEGGGNFHTSSNENIRVDFNNGGFKV